MHLYRHSVHSLIAYLHDATQVEIMRLDLLEDARVHLVVNTLVSAVDVDVGHAVSFTMHAWCHPKACKVSQLCTTVQMEGMAALYSALLSLSDMGK